MSDKPSSYNSDVTIIGAGVLGVSLAYHLGKFGLKTIVVEKEPTPGAHASGKNSGMFRHLYRHSQLSSWARQSLEILPKELKRDFFNRTGSLVVGREVPRHHNDLFEQTEIRASLLQGESIPVPAVRTCEDGLLDSPGYLNALYSLGVKSGTKYLFRERVSSIGRPNSDWQVITENGTTIISPWVVNAAGAWINEFLEPHCPWLQVDAKAYARHLLLVNGWKEDFMPAANCGFYWDERSNWYMRQWDKNSRLVSICDQVAANPETFTPSPLIREQTSRTLLCHLPSIANSLSISKDWHCFRTYTEDKLPIWGEDHEAPGLFWLAGFGGFGMSTSFAAASDAAKQIAGKKAIVSSDFYPERARPTPLPRKSAAI